MNERALRSDEWIEGRHVRLRTVTLDDCTQRYVEWLADAEVNRYLETRFSEQTIETIQAFVASMNATLQNYLLAIVERATGVHIGNIKVGPVNSHHQYADVSYFVGERSAWGRGLATDAVCAATKFAFSRLGMHRVQAGFYETNVGSQRVLTKAGFNYEGRLVKKLRQTPESPWEDHLWYYALAEEWAVPSEYLPASPG